ncbi:1,6-anhydro-N-acetylmuramyl-L-alanine amidase AmpD [Pseudoalteromonas xiamenensis]
MPIIDHFLDSAERRQSSHFDERPNTHDISLVVIHCISLPEGEFGEGYIDDLFMGCIDCRAHPSFQSLEGVRVSAHLVIDREGTTKQYVPFNKRAWHAGVSMFNGREQCNDFSIGIELEGTDRDSFTDQQYRKLSRIITELQIAYPNIKQNIVGHSDIAPGRKTDPGIGFDWDKLHAELKRIG